MFTTLVSLVAAIALSIGQTAPSTASGVRVSGRVITDTNAPIAGARVMLFPAGPRNGPFGPPPQALTDEDGRFVLKGVASGDYRMTAIPRNRAGRRGTRVRRSFTVL